MRVKELQKVVNVTWAPEQVPNILLAAGTAGQQLDTSFGSSVLEVYEVNLKEPGYDLELKGSINTQYKFHKLIWSPMSNQQTHGVIVGGCEGGNLQVFNAAKLLAGEDALIAQQNKHTGPIRALDYNPFQYNLLASGANESEIYIWDLNNTTTPMTPGNKTQPFEDIQNMAWNKQVQHILASVFSTRCIIWDLRKNEPIIKLSDSQTRVRWRGVQWHPQVATQLWLASEEDQSPVVQLWDLRYATAPAKTLQIHQRGMLDLSWCQNDNDLMLSCGKDNKILCWNPNVEAGSENPSEIATTLQWYSTIDWCPRNPALLMSASYEGNVSIYSLFGGTQQQVQTSNRIADSFPGMDQFDKAPVPQANNQTVYSDLKNPPKWLKRPVGATFGFGGKLYTFRNDNLKSIQVNQIVTDPELVERSQKLEEALTHGNYADYCRHKADQMSDQHNRYVWYFIKANFEQSPRGEMLNLLGYDTEDMNKKFEQYKEKCDSDINQLTNQMADLSRSDSSEVEGEPSTDYSTDTSGVDHSAIFDAIASKSNKDDERESNFPLKTGDDTDGLICQALLSGNTEAAVELCMENGLTTEGIILASTGGPELLARIQYKYLKNSKNYLSDLISAMVTRDWTEVISKCSIDSWQEALVATINHSKDQMPILCEKLGDRIQLENGNDVQKKKNAILCYICAGNISRMVEAWIDIVLGSSTNPSNAELQELIEVVMLLQKAMESQGRPVVPSGKLATFLNQYASLLSSQGALNSALTYLEPSDDPNMEDLRDRLYYALGVKQQQTSHVKKAPNTAYNGYSQPATNPQFNMPYNTAPHVYPSTSQQSFWNTAPMSNAAPTSMSSPVNNYNFMQPIVNNVASVPSQNFSPPQAQNFFTPPQQPVAPKPPVGPPPVADLAKPPSRPSSVGPQSVGGPLSRSKYVRDPSVQSGPSYGQTSNYFNPSQPQGGFNSTPFNSATPPVAPIQMQPQAQYNQFNTQPFGPSSNQPVSQPMNQTPFVPNYMGGQPMGMGNQMAPMMDQNPPPIAPMKNPTPPPGWNDPPPPKPRKQSLSQSQETTDVASAITHPIFGLDPNAGQQQNNYSSGMQHQQFAQPTPMTAAPQQTYPGQMQFNNQVQQNQFNTQPFGQTQQIQPVPQPAPQMQQIRQPEPEAPKPAMPEQYVYMQTVFNELRTQCYNKTSNPQTKRKLEDVAKRLETLYDMLRYNRLTPNTLDSLNQIVQLIQRGDYNNCLALHTQMVSGQDFSLIASFMPGIKVLIQIAMQVQVYLS